MHLNRNAIFGYTCFIEDVKVKSSNYRIVEIKSKHTEKDKTDWNVQTVYFRKSDLNYLPIFDDGYLTGKFPNVKRLDYHGEESSGQLNILSSLGGKTIVPGDIREFVVNHFGSKLNHVPADLLTKSPQLTKFLVQFDGISEIPNGFFDKNRNLEEINLGDNPIIFLPDNLLSKLPELRIFIVSVTKITYIPGNLFAHNAKLQGVWMYNNLITSIPENLFAHNPVIRIIQLYNNKIKFLPPQLIASNPHLIEFFANGNEIKEIPFNFRSNNGKLEKFEVL